MLTRAPLIDDTLRWGSAQDVGLDPFYVGAFADVAIVNTTFYEGSNHSIMPGAVTLAVQDGVIVSHQATGTLVKAFRRSYIYSVYLQPYEGYAYKYADYNGTYLPWWEMVCCLSLCCLSAPILICIFSLCVRHELRFP